MTSIDITPELRADSRGPGLWAVVENAGNRVIGEVVQENLGTFTRYGPRYRYRVASFSTLAAAVTLGEES